MSIHFSNFAVEIKPYRITDKRDIMYKCLVEGKHGHRECFVITAYEVAVNGMVKDLLEKGFKVIITKMEDKQC